VVEWMVAVIRYAWLPLQALLLEGLIEKIATTPVLPFPLFERVQARLWKGGRPTCLASRRICSSLFFLVL
jgi:hypothetical protein